MATEKETKRGKRAGNLYVSGCWQNCTWEETDAFPKDWAIVSKGFISQQGPHLPVAKDSLIVDEIAEQPVEEVTKSTLAILLPTTGYINLCCQRESLGTPSFSDGMFSMVVMEIGRSIIKYSENDFRCIFYLSEHGGDLAALQLIVSRGRLVVKEKEGICSTTANHWTLIKRTQMEDMPDTESITHTGEFEALVIKGILPELLRDNRLSKHISYAPNSYWGYWFSNVKVTLTFPLKHLAAQGLGAPVKNPVASCGVSSGGLYETVACMPMGDCLRGITPVVKVRGR